MQPNKTTKKTTRSHGKSQAHKTGKRGTGTHKQVNTGEQGDINLAKHRLKTLEFLLRTTADIDAHKKYSAPSINSQINYYKAKKRELELELKKLKEYVSATQKPAAGVPPFAGEAHKPAAGVPPFANGDSGESASLARLKQFRSLPMTERRKILAQEADQLIHAQKPDAGVPPFQGKKFSELNNQLGLPCNIVKYSKPVSLEEYKKGKAIRQKAKPAAGVPPFKHKLSVGEAIKLFKSMMPADDIEIRKFLLGCKIKTS